MQFPQTPTFKPQLFSLTFDGGIVVGDLETNNLYVKNAAAGAIWTLLQAGLTIREATSVLCQSFSLSEREALSHIDKMLGEWDLLGLQAHQQYLAPSLRNRSLRLRHQF